MFLNTINRDTIGTQALHNSAGLFVSQRTDLQAIRCTLRIDLFEKLVSAVVIAGSQYNLRFPLRIQNLHSFLKDQAALIDNTDNGSHLVNLA